MDCMLPIAKRTRLKEAEMYQKYHDEIKKKNLSEQSDASESTNLVELGRINSCYSCTNDCESAHTEDMGGKKMDGIHCYSPIKLDNLDDVDIEFLDEIIECDDGKEFISLDSDSEGLGNSHVGESTGFCFTNEKQNIVNESNGEHHHRMERNNRLGVTESSTSLKYSKVKQDDIDSLPCKLMDYSTSGLNFDGSKNVVDEDFSCKFVVETKAWEFEEKKCSGVVGIGMDSTLQEHYDNIGSGIEFCDGLDGEDQEDNDEFAEQRCLSDYEDSDDLADDEDYELSGSSAIIEESSSGEEGDRNARGSLLRKVSDDRDKKAEVRLNRKKVHGIEVLCDFNNCNVVVSVGKNCVAEHTRSHYISEINERHKLGTVSHPVDVDKDLNSKIDGSDIDYEKAQNSDHGHHSETIAIGRTLVLKNGKFMAEEGNVDECKKKLRGRYVTKRNYLHQLKDDEAVKMLANSILNEADMPGEGGEPVFEATLPLKFTFGTKDSISPQITDEEKELNELWAEMDLALYGDDDKDNAVHMRDEADVSLDIEHDRIEQTCLENHEFILDEEIGIKCKLCSYVDLEIRYCMPTFADS